MNSAMSMQKIICLLYISILLTGSFVITSKHAEGSQSTARSKPATGQNQRTSTPQSTTNQQGKGNQQPADSQSAGGTPDGAAPPAAASPPDLSSIPSLPDSGSSPPAGAPAGGTPATKSAPQGAPPAPSVSSPVRGNSEGAPIRDYSKSNGPEISDRESRQLVVDLLQAIQDDSDNHSYEDMLSDVKTEHTIKYHKPNAPFFYSNDKYVIKDILTMVMIDPNAIIDETKSGILKVYRDFEYHDELEDIFEQEPLYRRVIPEPKKFQDDYLGLANTGPTNRVMIVLRIKSDDQNANTFAQRINYTGNNIVFVDAFPAKGPPPPPKPKSDNNRVQQPKVPAASSQKTEANERKCGCNS